MRRMGVLGPRWEGLVEEEGLGGWGQGKLRREDGGREVGGEEGSVEWVLRREMLGAFSGSGCVAVGVVGSGQTVGVGLSKIVLRRVKWRPEDLREVGFRVGVSTSESGV